MDVVVSPSARDDIRAAHRYDAERHVAAAGRMAESLLAAIAGLAEFPVIGRAGIVPGTRERLLTRYPYKIVYEVSGNTISVVRVLHTSQRRP